ncbi:unnamed protein product, partial [Rotaria socialis]
TFSNSAINCDDTPIRRNSGAIDKAVT